MPSYPFGEWLPDHAPLGNQGVVVARNCVPTPTGYGPVRGLTASTDALRGRPLGAIQATAFDGSVYQYAGDATRLYENVGGTWVDRSKGGGEGEEEEESGPYGTDELDVWEFLPWKNKILAANFADFIQEITFGGTEFGDLTEDLRARHITAIRDFVVVANTWDAVDGDVPSRVRWSAFNNESDWTVSPATLADFQDLKTADIRRVFGGEFGVVMQADSVWRMSFVGAPVVFQFDEVLPGVGLLASRAAVQAGSTIYFLSKQGFMALEYGTRATPIGAGRVDDFFFADLDQDFSHRITSVHDVETGRILWAYPGPGNTGGRPNRVIVFDPTLNRWSLLAIELELLWRAGGTGTSLDSLTDTVMDELDISMDDNSWKGTAAVLAAFDSSYRSGFFNGEKLQAVIETREFGFQEDGRSFVKGFRMLHDGGTVTARLGSRNSLSDGVSYSAPLTPGAEGKFNTRSNARYHRMEFRIGGDWNHATGFEVGRGQVKSGGRRG